MSDLVPDHIDRLEAYRPGKPVSELQRELGIRSVVKLASNESPFGPSPKAVVAMGEAIASVHRYPDDRAYALREAIARHHDIRSDEIALGHGSNELIDLLVRTFATSDQHVVVGHPSFPCYELSCRCAAVPVSTVPLRDHLHWNVDDLIDAVRPETKIVFVANPNNPTGAYVAGTELERLLRSLPPRVVAVVDEAYFHFVDAKDYVGALSLRHLRERLVVLRTFSKAYGLAALRVGYAIGPATLIDYLGRLRAPFNVGTLGQIAALAALEDASYLEACLATNRTERARMASALSGGGLRVAPSQTNFLLVDFSKLGSEVYDRLLRKGVIARAMPPPIERWLRITIGLPEENDRLLEAVDELGEG